MYKVFGDTPERQLWLKWTEMEIGANGDASTWAVVLEEDADVIHIVEMDHSTSKVRGWVMKR